MLAHNVLICDHAFALRCDLGLLQIVFDTRPGPCLDDGIVLDRDAHYPTGTADEPAKAQFEFSLHQAGLEFQQGIKKAQGNA